MTFLRGDVVRSTAGHDKDGLFLVLQAEGDFVWLVDGKRRKLETPKKKRRKHVVSAGVWTHPVAVCKTASRCWTVTSEGRWPPFGIGSVRRRRNDAWLKAT